MDCLKRNKLLFSIVYMLPLFLFQLDRAVVEWVQYVYKNLEIHGVFERMDFIVDVMGNGAALIIGAGILLISGKLYSQKLYAAGKSLLAGLLTAGVSVQLIKHFIGRARPRVTHDSLFIGPSLQGGYDSFPSGHTTLAFCFAYILSQHFPRYKWFFYFFAAVVAFERVEDLAHFPSDVLAGMVLGIVIAKVFSLKMSPVGNQQQVQGIVR